jgi:hypothetical protein
MLLQWKIFAPVRNQQSKPKPRHYNNWAIPAPSFTSNKVKVFCIWIIFFSLEDLLEVLGDDKCFVVVYFQLTKIGIVLPFYFLPFTFIYFFCIFVLYCIACACVMLYCDTVVCVCCLCLSLILILVILWHVSYPAADGLILDWWHVNEMYVCK